MLIYTIGLPRWCSGKKSACQCRKCRRCRFRPEFGRSPREGNGNSLQYFCLGNPMDRGAWHAVVLGVARATEHAHPCLYLEYRYKIVTHSGIWVSPSIDFLMECFEIWGICRIISWLTVSVKNLILKERWGERGGTP